MAIPTPKHYWTFDDGKGTTAADAVGSGTMTLDKPSWRTGHLGGGVRFNPVDGAGPASTGLGPLRPPWTVACWVKREADTESSDGCSMLLSDNASALRLEQYRTRHAVGLTVFDKDDYDLRYVTRVGEWTHLTLVGDTGKVTLYAGGELVSTQDGAFDLPLAYVGSLDGREVASALIDELSVYAQALTGAQVAELYQQSLLATPKLVVSINGERTAPGSKKDLGKLAAGASATAKIEIVSTAKGAVTFASSGEPVTIEARLASTTDIPIAPGSMLSAYAVTVTPKTTEPLRVTMKIKSEDPMISEFTCTLAVNEPAPPPVVQPTPPPAPVTSAVILRVPAGPFRPGASVTFSWAAPSNHSPTDWIGMFKVGAENRSYGTWKHVPVGSSGTMELTLPTGAATGDRFELRYLIDNGYTSTYRSSSFVIG